MAKRWLIGGKTYVLASNYDAAEARIRELKSRISEGERLFKKMLMMSGSELGGPHPIWADVERWLGDPPSSQSDREAKQ